MHAALLLALMQHPNALSTLMPQAEAIAAVEILSTDYTATAADGPMYASARVLRPVKGSLRTQTTFRFAASAWAGPNYRPGEKRIVFLQKAPPAFPKAPWMAIEPGRIDLFIDEDAISRLSESSLAAYFRAGDERKQIPSASRRRVFQSVR